MSGVLASSGLVEQLRQQRLPVLGPRHRTPGFQRHPLGRFGRAALVQDDWVGGMRATRAIDQAYGVEILNRPVRATSHPVRRLHLDQLAEDDLLGRLFGNLPEHSRGRRLVIIQTTAWHSPSTGDGSSVGVLGGEQAAARLDYRVRGEALPHRGPDAIAEHQPSVASLPARLRARLVDDRAYQQSKDQLARAGSIGVEGSHHCVALIECEHVRISTVIEKHLERVPTMLRDADDQHVVIIPQKGAAASVGNRAPPHGEGASRGVLSSASDDDGGGLQARCASSSKSVVSGASVDVALHGRADFSHQVISLAIHQDRQSQDVPADH